ncbi:DNA cytosine methyltransferase [Streptococcus thermophilus]|uniref:DNA cytosine methyltransferase n=1 Tax=Streptococcus thermophilus TaxID=1308 RepID=UPI000C222B27|nr:DNA cytosine methyltransferase [Streptococcus thermophilus]MBW7799689.1 DNA cytosine methyltransferase [Streptococcus thermophilus]MBW7817614.1 DNA cytosine methyltransferase [Streptococcus thermophilus]MDA5520423.1 DNA cytosine methyltransferase [Streptococcus thermophilus]MDA5542256.1 DNA cytosine methyltransferase [Streptococcus thermophilus]MDW2957686.1 DNA cytosine methyltransferase [Streptococcus thermophilus]
MTNSVSSKTQNKYNIAAFFSGVGGIELGFEQTNKFRVVYANEFDKYARETYSLNYPDTKLDARDIHIVPADEVVDQDGNDNIDIVVGGFPCQAFSIAGYRKGFEDDRGDLFFELLRIIEAKKPKAIFVENVKNMVSHDHGNTFKVIREALTENNYFIKWKVLNGKDYGNIPQNRERIYIVGFDNKETYDLFEFPEEIELTTSLRDIIDFGDKKDELYYYREGKQRFFDELKLKMTSQDTVYQWRRQYVRENKNGVVPTLTANMGTGGHNVPLILTDSGEIRKLTPKETFNVQGYPKSFKIPENVSNGQLYKQAGNSVVVPVIKRIATNISKALDESNGKSQLNRDGKIAIIYTKMNGQFEGQSYVKEFVDSYEQAVSTIDSYEDSLSILSDEEYLKLVKKKGTLEFYSIN